MVRRLALLRLGAVLGTLNATGTRGGAIEVTTSLDGRFAFVSLEGRQALAVFNLRRALTKGFGRARAGGFPREMAVLPGRHTLLVGNFDSDQIESVDTAGLP